MAAQSFNVGVVGYGMSAKVFHIPLIQHVEGLNLYAILQRSPKPDDDASKDHPESKHYRDLAGLLSDSHLDVVVVTSTPETHYEITSAALEAGKHVVVEKPFAHTSRECEDLVEKAKKAEKILTVYQNRRWDLDFLTLKSLIDKQQLGRIVEFETHFDRWRPAAPSSWKSRPTPGNGVIYDLGSHLLDQVVTLFGMPESVTGHIYSQRDGGAAKGAEDSCTVMLHYADGMLATAKASVISPETDQLRFWVRGTKGSFKKEDELKAGATPSSAGFGSEPESQYGTFTKADGSKLERTTLAPVKPQTYTAFYSSLLSALRGQSGPPVDAAVAAGVIGIIELALQSSEKGVTMKVQGSRL